MLSRSRSQSGSGGPQNTSAISSHRRQGVGAAGTRRAASRPATVISISSPASTRRTSSDAAWRNSRSPTVAIDWMVAQVLEPSAQTATVSRLFPTVPRHRFISGGGKFLGRGGCQVLRLRFPGRLLRFIARLAGQFL